MISRLRGEIVEITGEALIVIDVAGVGYEVSVTSGMLPKLKLNSTTLVIIRSITREDGVVLYGFEDHNQRNCFDQLRTVQGVGPQLALAILSSMGVEGVRLGVARSTPGAFKEVSGVGQRIADRLVLELKRFVDLDQVEVSLSDRQGQVKEELKQVREALVTLGFTSKEIDLVVRTLPDDVTVEEAVSVALKKLSK